MKFDKQKAFPYPVLRPQSDDYMDIEFQATAEFLVSKDKIKVNVSYAISCAEIIKEVAKGRAEYISTISCRDTYFQKVVSSSSKSASAEFEDGELRGEVRVNPYIVVKKAIPKFSSPDINSELVPVLFSLPLVISLHRTTRTLFILIETSSNRSRQSSTS